ncbi:MAG: heavy metal transporter [Kordiimonas sp.]|nr:heavy metal transporter [Kordiimonas sp.]
MKRMFRTLGVVMALVMAAPVIANAASDTSPSVEKATEKTVNFAIEKMTCAMCPITVRKAMEKVDGVLSVVTDFETRSAVVVFDPSKTTEAAIARASEDAGYPAIPEKPHASK